MSLIDAVADPVRLRVLRHLSGGEAASMGELAEVAGVHVNTVRPHVAALEQAGVIERLPPAPSGRGRPIICYRLAEDWSLPSSDFRGLAQLLAAVALRAGASPRHVRSVGADWGRYLQGRPGGHDVEADLPSAMERLGFDAEVDGSTLRLSSCPCPLVLSDHPELVCELAAAVAQGVLDGSASGLTTGDRTHDVERRACSVKLVSGRRPGAPRRRPRARR